MKSSILFSIVLTILSITAFSQNNFQYLFPDSNAVWRINYTYYDLWQDSFEEKYLYPYGFAGDTLISGINFTQIRQSREKIFNGHNSKFIGGIVDSNGKWMFIRADSTKIKLLYDFNVMVGDTVNVERYWDWTGGDIRAVVTSVDLVMVGGALRKQIDIEYDEFGFFTDSWIEGIGSVNGLLFPCMNWGYMDGGINRLVCFYENNVEIFKGDGYVDCDYHTTVGVNDEEVILQNIYPTPTSNNLTISSIEISSLKVYNLLGKNVLSESNLSGDQHTIDVSSMNNGVYFLSVTNLSNQNQTVKFIVKH